MCGVSREGGTAYGQEANGTRGGFLEPHLGDPDRTELLDTCLGSVLALPPEPGRDRDEDGGDTGYREVLYGDTISALKDLLKSLLQRSLTPHGLQDMFAHLGPWIKSSKEHERQRAVEVSAALLDFYLSKLNVSTVIPFYNLGVLIALFSPRCSDSLASVRQHAIDCVYSLLYIQLCYEGFARDHRDEMVEGLKALKKGLEEPDFTVLFHTCTNIAMVIGKRIPPEQLMSLLLAMFEGLADPDKNCSRAATVMINSLLKERGAVLQEKVKLQQEKVELQQEKVELQQEKVELQQEKVELQQEKVELQQEKVELQPLASLLPLWHKCSSHQGTSGIVPVIKTRLSRHLRHPPLGPGASVPQAVLPPPLSPQVLWPYLLEFVTPIPFTNALTPLCKSLLHLALKKQEEGESASLIRYDLNANLPSPHALTTRLLVVSSQPYAGDGRGAAALRLLSVLRCSLHPALEPLWSKRVPVLNFLYKCIGTTLGACASKDLVLKQLQELLETARYHEEVEREGLASCFGICAINHLEETLAKLEDFVKSDVFKKSVGLFSIFRDRSDNEVEKIKSTLILCYGYVAMYAPKELVLARIEADILKNIFQYFNTKDLTLKLCLVRSICMISQAIYNGAKCGDFVFSRKAELVAQMVEFIKAEPLDALRTPVRQRAMVTCTYLVYPSALRESRSQGCARWSCCAHRARPHSPVCRVGLTAEPGCSRSVGC
ncbi:maestro heat-like repeat-containing protein family member 1 isoform A [Patagioenas fasciata monilis]|uniref:Maestro heat-like repeat-containing protein family member 1 isoform A n=1 Tax=Patagioenas fasciata monilis TaxID=372326 RepID=A0A1V4JZE0_PATFA|nr:maestro heat-like repeat-containing protein family member 1 isoform A [Patagioenas fasciata monilis]